MAQSFYVYSRLSAVTIDEYRVMRKKERARVTRERRVSAKDVKGKRRAFALKMRTGRGR